MGEKEKMTEYTKKPHRSGKMTKLRGRVFAQICDKRGEGTSMEGGTRIFNTGKNARTVETGKTTTGIRKGEKGRNGIV